MRGLIAFDCVCVRKHLVGTYSSSVCQVLCQVQHGHIRSVHLLLVRFHFLVSLFGKISPKIWTIYFSGENSPKIEKVVEIFGEIIAEFPYGALTTMAA